MSLNNVRNMYATLLKGKEPTVEIQEKAYSYAEKQKDVTLFIQLLNCPNLDLDLDLNLVQRIAYDQMAFPKINSQIYLPLDFDLHDHSSFLQMDYFLSYHILFSFCLLFVLTQFWFSLIVVLNHMIINVIILCGKMNLIKELIKI